jgi:hypothetical protein
MEMYNLYILTKALKILVITGDNMKVNLIEKFPSVFLNEIYHFEY